MVYWNKILRANTPAKSQSKRNDDKKRIGSFLAPMNYIRKCCLRLASDARFARFAFPFSGGGSRGRGRVRAHSQRLVRWRWSCACELFIARIGPRTEIMTGNAPRQSLSPCHCSCSYEYAWDNFGPILLPFEFLRILVIAFHFSFTLRSPHFAHIFISSD